MEASTSTKPVIFLAFLLACSACNRPMEAPAQKSAGAKPLAASSKASEAARVPTSPANAQSSVTGPDAAIRAANFENLMEAFFLKSAHETDIHEASKDSLRTEIEISTKAFGDLDGDGREEAAVTAYSCMAGQGGPDMIAVFAMNSDGVVRELKIEPRERNQPFKGRDPSLGLRGQMTVVIENGRMIEKLPIFQEADGECCAL
jgi:hypothetical protein